MTKTITEGNRAVIINGEEGFFWANLYVNARNGIEGADITSSRWEGKTLKGAEKWAAKKFFLANKSYTDAVYLTRIKTRGL